MIVGVENLEHLAALWADAAMEWWDIGKWESPNAVVGTTYSKRGSSIEIVDFVAALVAVVGCLRRGNGCCVLLDLDHENLFSFLD